MAENQSARNGDVRVLSSEAASKLFPGADHYTAYVGPPEQYDFMGATQFRLLTALGLREHHSLLDFGCGSLRAGRLLIPYLLPGRYYGLEPNRWLVDAGIDEQIGRSMLELKRPTFLYHSDFCATRFGVTFDYIVAQSIFSHCGRDIIAKSCSEFRACLSPSGLVLATFVQPHQLGEIGEYGGTGWIYPSCVTYEGDTILGLARDAGLVGRLLPWFHPRQTWFALAHSADQLPTVGDDIHLTGAVLRAPELQSNAPRVVTTPTHPVQDEQPEAERARQSSNDPEGTGRDLERFIQQSRIATKDPRSGDLLARNAELEAKVADLQKICNARQEVIAGLDQAARERLDLINRLDAEVRRLQAQQAGSS